MDPMNQGGANVCKCPHHKMWGLFVVAFGLVFLGEAFGWWSSGTVMVVWPIIVIAVGLFKLMESKCKCC